MVLASTLDRELISTKPVPTALLTLEVQGYEGRVLDGGHVVLERIDYIVLETSFQPLYAGEPVLREASLCSKALARHF